MALGVRLARSLVYLLESGPRTATSSAPTCACGPHPPGHPLALSTEAAELYYERLGQNWERAALIKARAVAGDVAGGRGVPAALRPFIWRKHLDYAAIRDIHSIKRQINAHRGFGTMRVRGHDLKVGRGGIREIEFFAQTQQLILGGRVPELRCPRTSRPWRRSAERRWVDETAAARAGEAYRLLRALEHRLQMVADKQTQTLPERERELRAGRRVRRLRRPGEPSRTPCCAALHDRRAPLCGAVRGARPIWRRRQPGVHRHRRRPRHARDARRHGLQGPGRGLGPDPRLAPRPHPRHAQHPGARAADRAGARPA